MARRIHIPALRIGDLRLDPAQAHHARDVLRLVDGTTVEAFDDAGATAPGVLIHHPTGESDVRIEQLNTPASISRLNWTVASAVPKGDRADWMVEKLSELGAAAFIPLATARSVVLPEGKNKRQRWTRIATEAAKQSRRVGVMRVEELMPLEMAVKRVQGSGFGVQAGAGSAVSNEPGSSAGWVLATEVPAALPIREALEASRSVQSLALFIGPEGGWTEQELTAFAAAGLTAVRLGTTTLRIETAAIVAGAVVACFLG